MFRMKAPIGALLVALATAFIAAAEEPAEDGQPTVGMWSLASELNVTLTQNAYSDNWAGSELGSASWAVNSNTLAESQLTPRFHSSTSLRMAFGQTHTQDPETKDWRKPVKSTDLVDLESILRLTRGWVVDPFAGLRVETQFIDESDPANKRALNPAVITGSFGVARVFVKEESREFSARVGGALRRHVYREAATGDGDERATKTTTDGGAELVLLFRTPLAEDKITFLSELTTYRAFYNSEEEELAGTEGSDDWKSVDVNWENTLTANVTNYLMVNLYVQTLYDKEVADDLRLKETLSLGFTFKMM